MVSKDNQQRTIREMLEYIKKRPGMYLGEKEGRIDYLRHFLAGWFWNNDEGINGRYRAGIAHYIYEWIRKNKSNEFTKIEFSFLWYKMIYSVTDTEADAWELFFKLSYEYLDCLEAEVNKE